MPDIMDDKFKPIFEALKPLLHQYEADLHCVTDKDELYYLDTHHIMPNNKPLYFGSVQIKKNYVAFHLMPIYVFPELLVGMSSGLKKRMQGKSCFNFKKTDLPLFAELAGLTQAGFKSYQNAGYIK